MGLAGIVIIIDDTGIAWIAGLKSAIHLTSFILEAFWIKQARSVFVENRSLGNNM